MVLESRSYRAPAIGPGAALQVVQGGARVSGVMGRNPSFFPKKASWSHSKACLDARGHWSWNTVEK